MLKQPLELGFAKLDDGFWGFFTGGVIRTKCISNWRVTADNVGIV